MILSIDFRTDVPAFYSEWILNRFREGYVMFRNPAYPGKIHKVILDRNHIEGIMWCSKDYSKILPNLNEITDKFPSIFHYTINGYGGYIEPNVPKVKDSIKTFIEMSKKYGSKKVIWRYDPILFTKDYGLTEHILTFGNLAYYLSNFTDRVVINFVSLYDKVKKNMPEIIELSYEDKLNIIRGFLKICKDTGLKLQTCGNGLQFKDLEGVTVTGCLDRTALELLNIYTDYNKKPSPLGCLCYPNTSIGAYNTCMHKCKYCYASSDFEKCEDNYYNKHDPMSPLLIGNITSDDIIEEMKPKLLNTHQLSLSL